MHVGSYLPLLVVDALGTSSGWPVVGNGDVTCFNQIDVLNEDLIVPLDFLGWFPIHSSGNILPTVWGILVVQSQSPLELLVLFCCPWWAWVAICIERARCHCAGFYSLLFGRGEKTEFCLMGSLNMSEAGLFDALAWGNMFLMKDTYRRKWGGMREGGEA